MNSCTIDKNVVLSDLINNIPGGCFVYTAKSHHIEFSIWNKYMIEITGYTLEEINKIGWNNILCNTCSISDFISNFDIKEDYQIISKNGVKKTINISTSIVNTKDEKDNVLALVTDITKHKQVEQELKEIEERYEKFLELSTDSILIHDSEKIVKVNNNTFDMLGIKDSNDIIEQSLYKYIDPLFHNIVQDRVKIQLETKGYVPIIEETLIDVNGKNIYAEVTSSYAPYKGKKCIFTFIRNISSRKKAEELEKVMKEKSRLLDEAAEYEKLRTEFFANISHELKTPINVILSVLQLLNLKTYNINETCWSQKEYLKKYPEIMKQNCYRLVRLVNNLIDVTKIDSGYFNLNLINANIVNVVEDITLSVVDYTGNNGITLTFDTDIEEKILACDPDKIERIILNLISNAVKFTESGGNILVRISDKGQGLIISVKDTGIGISKDKQQIIFERFIQVEKSLARNREGSGIGLSLVKSLVEMHNGTIAVKSELNKGSEFIINLPYNLVNEKNDTDSNKYFVQENSEKINIEFSDIYC